MKVRRNRTDFLKKTFGLKQKTKIGCWNVRTLRESGRLKQVEKVMSDCGMEIIGLGEVSWKDFGEITTQNGNTLLCPGPSGGDVEHQNGVGLLLSKTARMNLIEWEPISDRTMTASFRSLFRNIAIIQCYAPTEIAEIENKAAFYQLLNETLNKVKRRNIKIMLGDMNAQKGPENEGLEDMG
jgi:exonuclease III